MTTSGKTATKPVGRLDASMLLARKGEAQPAVRATTQNNPGLAWGVHTPAADAHHPSQPQPRAVHTQPPVSQGHRPTASARLRADSFMGQGQQAHSLGRSVSHDRDPVALTLRVEDNTYLRLAYLAQAMGTSVQKVLASALEHHLTEHGLPVTRKLVVRPK